jgi:hypothetical protein
VRVTIEASDRRLYRTAAFVKASGLRVCAAPGSDRQAGAQVIGQMRLGDLTNNEIAAATQLRRRVQLDIKHPRNTSLRMNQVTMMFIPLRFITRIEVWQGDHLDMDGGMTSESVRKHHVGLQSFRSMKRIDARSRKVSALRLRFSQSLVNLRQRLSQAMVRSTIQRRGNGTKPLA